MGAEAIVEEQSVSLQDNEEEVNIVEKPRKWNVVFFDDDVTPAGFVSMILVKEFGLSDKDSIALVMKIQADGKGVAGTYFKDIAEAKKEKVISSARMRNFPLEVKVEVAE